MNKEIMTYQEAYKRLNIIRKEILPHSEEIMEEHRFEVFAAIERLYEVLDEAFHNGLSGLEREKKKIAEGGTDLEDILLEGMDECLFFDGKNTYRVFALYDKCERENWKDFIRYIYIRGVMMMTIGLGPDSAVRLLMSLLPDKDAEVLKKIFVKRGVKYFGYW